MKKVELKKEKLLISIIVNTVFFITGLLFICVPSYYGVNTMEQINSNQLFVNAMLIIALLKFVEFYINGKNPTNENILIAIASIICSILNRILVLKFYNSYSLTISMLSYVFLYSAIKIFTIDYYHDRKNKYYIIEGLITVVIFVVGVFITFNMFNEPVLQTIEMGFYIILISVLETFGVVIKTILISKDIIKKIKVM